MPAIITHDLFGKDVYGETFDTIGYTGRQRRAAA